MWREGVVTDNGNIILDVHGLTITDPLELESVINNMTGVVCNGIFAHRPADVLLISNDWELSEFCKNSNDQTLTYKDIFI